MQENEWWESVGKNGADWAGLGEMGSGLEKRRKNGSKRQPEMERNGKEYKASGKNWNKARAVACGSTVPFLLFGAFRVLRGSRLLVSSSTLHTQGGPSKWFGLAGNYGLAPFISLCSLPAP